MQYGDLARLVGRISVVLANEKADAPPTVIDVGRRRADGGAAMETREQLHRLVDTVASCVETPAQYEAIMDQTESILFGSGTPPHPSNPGLVERLFQDGIGLGSATSRVGFFSCVQFPALVSLNSISSSPVSPPQKKYVA